MFVRIYQPTERPDTLPALLWIHGGGYVLGSVERDDLLAAHLAKVAQCVVVSVEYRLAYLGREPGGADVSPYAAAARADDLAGLPPAYIPVGDLDLFLDENIEYAQRLLAAGVPTELHIYPGGYHGFNGFAPDADIAQRFNIERDEALRRILHR